MKLQIILMNEIFTSAASATALPLLGHARLPQYSRWPSIFCKSNSFFSIQKTHQHPIPSINTSLEGSRGIPSVPSSALTTVQLLFPLLLDPKTTSREAWTRQARCWWPPRGKFSSPLAPSSSGVRSNLSQFFIFLS